MRKTRKKVLFGLTALMLVTVVCKTTIKKIMLVNSDIICSYQSEPDNYEGVGILGFNDSSIVFYII